MSTAKGERHEGRVRDVVQSGEGVVETARGVLLVRGVLPGEQVVVEQHPKERKGRARLLKVLSASPERVEPPCPYAARCGGCALMHADSEAQRRLRRGFLEGALAKAGLLGDTRVTLHAGARALGYRGRARLAFSVRGKERLLGFRREGRGDLVDVARCAVLTPALDTALEAVRRELLPLLVGTGELGVYQGREGGAVVSLHAAEAQLPALYTQLGQLVAQGALVGAALFAVGAPVPATFGDARVVTTDAAGAPLMGAVGGFSQANAEVNTLLVRRVLELAEPSGMRVLELYAGHGNFSVELARHALAYTAVERDAAATKALVDNAAARGLVIKSLAGEAVKHRQREPVDVVVLDPPRTGERGLLSTLAALKPKRIVYVSCDPATLARDLAEAAQAGYRVDTAEAFDMFPQTAELESVVRLVRVG
jgi:23S rRNA (uracil1939-C5)-methyltransferase